MSSGSVPAPTLRFTVPRWMLRLRSKLCGRRDLASTKEKADAVDVLEKAGNTADPHATEMQKGSSSTEAGQTLEAGQGTHLHRLMMLLVLMIGLVVVGKVTGAADKIDTDHIKKLVQKTGAFGWLLIAGLMSVGELVHVPAVIIYAACLMIYGKFVGFFVGWFAVIVSMTFSFFVVRKVGGDGLSNIKNKRVQKILAHLEVNPISVVMFLRVFLFAAPPLNYALALSRISFYHYIIGSAVGVMPPLVVIALVIEEFTLFSEPIVIDSVGISNSADVAALGTLSAANG